jgi:hypothetical protein
MTWSEFRHLIDDSPSVIPNHPEFQEHRWDQAILTTLAYHEGIKLHWWPAVYNWFVPGGPVFTYEKGDYKDDYPPLYHHHRLRDHEWVVADFLNAAIFGTASSVVVTKQRKQS